MSPDKMSPEKMSPDKMTPEKMSHGQNVTGQNTDQNAMILATAHFTLLFLLKIGCDRGANKSKKSLSLC